jgi:hypothetical protein
VFSTHVAGLRAVRQRRGRALCGAIALRAVLRG